MTKTTHIRTSKKIYYAAIVLCILFVLSESIINRQSLFKVVSGTSGIAVLVIIFYSLYKIFFAKGKIKLTDSQFKLQGHSRTSWNDLVSVYPFTEQDFENGEQHFINFRLTDGTDHSVRSEYLEMNFEQIAELVSQHKNKYANTNL
jgi:hypothetical protein